MTTAYIDASAGGGGAPTGTAGGDLGSTYPNPTVLKLTGSTGAIDATAVTALKLGGATPASTGTIRLNNNNNIVAINVAGNTDLQLLGIDSSNVISVGNAGVPCTVSGAGLSLHTNGGLTHVQSSVTLLSINAASGDQLSLGAAPASTGSLRLSSANGIASRNAANSADISLLYADASDHVFVGGNASNPSGRLQNVINTSADANLYLQNVSSSGLAGIVMQDNNGSVQCSVTYNNASSGLLINGHATCPLLLSVNAVTQLLVDGNNQGVQLFNGSTSDLGGGAGMLGIHNCTTAPTTNPTNGGIMFVQNGVLKYRGSSGTITIIANA